MKRKTIGPKFALFLWVIKLRLRIKNPHLEHSLAARPLSFVLVFHKQLTILLELVLMNLKAFKVESTLYKGLNIYITYNGDLNRDKNVNLLDGKSLLFGTSTDNTGRAIPVNTLISIEEVDIKEIPSLLTAG
jgi:hypothetical protein